MRHGKKRAAILLCSVAMVAATSSVFARPAHKAGHRHLVHRHAVHRHAVAQPAATAFYGGAEQDPRYPNLARRQAAAAMPHRRHRRHGRRQVASTAPALGNFTSNSLVAEARKYLGTNPTGRRSLWCGAFMDMVLKRTGHKGGGNLALGYAHYGSRVSGPQIGAIAVMGRRGGGHVGVVSGIDPNGNPIIVSGNHNHTVAEAVYPRGRIFAYVMPN
jgi:uncharacterized protein (TIGR02594 family)